MAAAPELLVDMNPQLTSQGSIPQHFAEFNGNTYFLSGRSLWKTDGTAAGTDHVIDSAIYDGEYGNSDGPFVELNGRFYFPAYSAEHGIALWTTDGTSAGTHFVAETDPGPAGFRIEYLTNVSGTLFFTTSTPETGIELWKWDGVAPNAELVIDSTPGIGHSNPHELTNVNGELYFLGYQEEFAHDLLFKSDGTADGTVVVADVEKTSSWRADELTNVNGRLLFSAPNPNGLWTSDGTPEGTVPLKEFSNSYGNVKQLTVVGDQAYFWVTDETHYVSLWKTDGTVAGTTAVAERLGTSSLQEGSLVNVGGTVYFISFNAANVKPTTLWKVDPTTDQVIEVASSSTGYQTLRSFQNQLYFFSRDDVGTGLWTSDGTAEGTRALNHFVDDNPAAGKGFAYELFVASDRLYMSADDHVHGTELWASDGTSAGTGMLKDIIDHTGDSSPQTAMVVGDAAYFSTDNNLWKTDGTSAGTVVVKDASGADVAGSYLLGNLNGLLIFNTRGGLSRSDGTAEGTYTIKKITAYSHWIVGDLLYFRAPVGFQNQGFELWRTDGTAAGTFLVSDIQPGVASSAIPNLIDFQGQAFFAANDGTHGSELWKTSGDQGNAVRITNFPGSGSLGYLAEFGGSFYFARTVQGPTIELWKSQGTAESTSLVRTIDKATFSTIDKFIATSDRLYFIVDEPLSGAELWTTDGTATGTYLVADVMPGAGGSNATLQAAIGNIVYFTADDGIHGPELWKSDGTAAGTQLVSDIREGSRGSDPHFPVVVGNQIYFTATGLAGMEYWRTDGTAAGTRQVADLRYGDSGPRQGVVFGGQILVPAADDSHGYEMWKFDLNDLPELTSGPVGVFIENGSPVFVVPQATVTDQDNATFSGGRLTVEITGGAGTGDQLLLRSYGSGASALIISGSEVHYGGTLIGTWSRAVDGRSLAIDLNAQASLAAVRSLTAAVSFTTPGRGPTPGPRTIRFTLNDGDGPSSSQMQVALQVRTRNDAPVLNTSLSPTLGTILEDAKAPTGTLLKYLVGNSISDVDLEALKGIAVTGASGASGNWQFSLNGTSWHSLGVTSESAARLLPVDATTRIRFIPNADFNGQVRLFYRAWDQSNGAAVGSVASTVGKRGGVQPFSTAYESATLIVAPVVDPPKVVLRGNHRLWTQSTGRCVGWRCFGDRRR